MSDQSHALARCDATQITNLRYGRVQLCATLNTHSHRMEPFASTRVRQDGQCTDWTTGKIVAAVFRHDTSRALDPHLHSHCIVLNATHDPVERCWKALQNHDILVVGVVQTAPLK